MVMRNFYKICRKTYIVNGHQNSQKEGLNKMDDLRLYVLFNSVSVISGRFMDDNERLSAMELRLRLRRYHLE